MISEKRLDLMLNDVSAASGYASQWDGGRGTLIVEATWGGGNTVLQYKSPNGTWITVPNSTSTANDLIGFELPPGQLRIVATTATAVYAYVIGSLIQ